MRAGVSAARVSLLAGVAAVVAMLPTAALANLPDGRIYEQVSPADKDGNIIFPDPAYTGNFDSMLGSATGNAVEYETSGPVGALAVQGGLQQQISRRTPGVGWSTEPADPRQLGVFGLESAAQSPGFYPSADFSRVVFDPSGCCNGNSARYAGAEPSNGKDLKLFMSENPLVEPDWLGRPAIASPIPELGSITQQPSALIAGMAPDARTGYFSYTGTLLAEDETSGRAQHVEANEISQGAPGFYEWAPGPAGEEIREAGVLPNGRISPYGAVGASLGVNSVVGQFEIYNSELLDNQVSQDGTHAFFVSPLPEFSKRLNSYCPTAQVHQEEKEMKEKEEKEKLGETGVVEPHIQVCTDELPELYMREALPNGAHRTTLVSRSEISQPAGAPVRNGARAFGDPPGITNDFWGATYAYASPDGSHVFFASVDPLTSTAPQRTELQVNVGCNSGTGNFYTGGSFTLAVTVGANTQTTAPITWPTNATKVESALAALSNVGAGNVQVAETGCNNTPSAWNLTFPKVGDVEMSVDSSALVGASTEGNYVANQTQPSMYEADTTTGQVTSVANMGNGEIAASSNDGSRVMFFHAGEIKLLTNGAGGITEETIASKVNYRLDPARATADGSVFLFYAEPSGGESTLSSFNTGGFAQFYRYDVANRELTCVSCPPAGVNPSGPAETNLDNSPRTVQNVRMMSADGSRIFFQSPDPLVAADVNGQPDVYEWENGHIYLISGGTAPVASFYIDNSETGGDVFFVTQQGLVPSDEDESTDVYDARIPRPGDSPPPAKTPCSGEVCQGPPSVPQLLTAGGSATFEGLGNIPPEASPATTAPVKTKCRAGTVLKKGKCVKKSRPAKGRRAKGKRAKKKAKGSRRRNRRGK